MNYQEELSSFSVNFKLEQIPSEVMQRAKLILLDSMTAIIEGNQSLHIKKLQQECLTNHPSSTQDATKIYGTDVALIPQLAAMINGIAMVSEEMDEGNPIAKGHPSCHFLPALLAFSENRKVSGYNFLESFILGYEIGARAGASIQLRNDIHPHGNWGLIGSGFAIGKIHGYTEEEFARAFTLSSSLPNLSLWQPVLEGHRLRDVYIGLNNLHAYLLPTLVRAGFSSSPTSMEEIYGNGILGNNFEPLKLIDSLGTKYYLMKTYFKFYSFCRFCHSPIDGILEALALNELRPEDIDRIDVHTYSLAAKLAHQQVNNRFAGKFSIPYAVASMVYEGETEEKIMQFAENVFVKEDPNLTKLLPNQRNARVEVFTTNNERIIVNVQGATGDSGEDNLEGSVIEKCRNTLQSIIGPTQTEELIDHIFHLEEIDSMSEILEYTQPK